MDYDKHRLILDGTNTELTVGSGGMVIVDVKSPVKTIIMVHGDSPPFVDIQWNGHQKHVVMKDGRLKVRGSVDKIDWYDGEITVEGNGKIKTIVVHSDKHQTTGGPIINFDRAFPKQIGSIIQEEDKSEE